MLHPQTYRTCSPLTHQKDRKAVTAAMADWLGGGGGVLGGGGGAEIGSTHTHWKVLMQKVAAEIRTMEARRVNETI